MQQLSNKIFFASVNCIIPKTRIFWGLQQITCIRTTHLVRARIEINCVIVSQKNLCPVSCLLKLTVTQFIYFLKSDPRSDPRFTPRSDPRSDARPNPKSNPVRCLLFWSFLAQLRPDYKTCKMDTCVVLLL